MKYISLEELPEKSVSHNPRIKKKVFLTQKEIPNLINFAQAKLSSGQISPAHSHQDMYEVFYVEAGKGIIKINDEEFPFERGNCVTVEPDEKHEIINNSSEDLIINYFAIKVN